MKSILVAATLTLSLLPLRARACGMLEPPITGTPAERIAKSLQYLHDGANGTAWRVAQSVLDMKAVPSALRAEADVVEGVVLWQSGQHDGAMKKLREAQKLDAKQVDAVIARVDADTAAAIREALA